MADVPYGVENDYFHRRDMKGYCKVFRGLRCKIFHRKYHRKHRCAFLMDAPPSLDCLKCFPSADWGKHRAGSIRHVFYQAKLLGKVFFIALEEPATNRASWGFNLSTAQIQNAAITTMKIENLSNSEMCGLWSEVKKERIDFSGG